MENFSFDWLKENLEKDDDFYQKIAGLCVLVVNGISGKLKGYALSYLENFLSSDINVASIVGKHLTRIYLTDSSRRELYYIISYPSGYRIFLNSEGEPSIFSVN